MSFFKQSYPSAFMARPHVYESLVTESHNNELSCACAFIARVFKRSSLVDPASSHMLVSKIKPCMSQCMPN